MTATDILTGTGELELKWGGDSDLNNSKYSGLYANGENYYIANAGYYGLLVVLNGGNVEGYAGNGERGVRPVVSLKSNVKTSAMDTQGRWLIEIE